MGRRAGLQKMDSWVENQWNAPSKAPTTTERITQSPQDREFIPSGTMKTIDDSGLQYAGRASEIGKYAPGSVTDADIAGAYGAQWRDASPGVNDSFNGINIPANEAGYYVHHNPGYSDDTGWQGWDEKIDPSGVNKDDFGRRMAMWNYFVANNPNTAGQAAPYKNDYLLGRDTMGNGGVNKITGEFQRALGTSSGGQNYYDMYMSGKQAEQPQIFQNTQPMEGAGSQLGGAQMNAMKPDGYADGGMVGLGTGGGQASAPMLALRYADGGMIPGQAGMQAPGGPQDPKMAEMQIKDVVQKNPQVTAQIKQVVSQAMQQAGITPPEAQQIAQYAKAAMHNPGIWPQLRNFAIQQGVPAQMIPEQYDAGLVYAILIAAEAMTDGNGGVVQQQPGMQQPGQAPGGQYADGGMILGPGTGRSDSIDTVNQDTGQPVKVSNGEYIIPAHVVEAKGKDFFDSMLRKYAPIQQGGGK